MQYLGQDGCFLLEITGEKYRYAAGVSFDFCFETCLFDPLCIE